MTAPGRVSKQEQEEHERTRMPFRAWCPYHAKSIGKNRVHKKKKDENEDAVNKVPRVTMDYFFMSEEDSNGNKNPILDRIGVGSDREMGWLVRDRTAELKEW